MSSDGANLLVECLQTQGVDRIFCVPGESYLAVLDALRDAPIDTVVARQEGGAAMMAEADGKLTARPGICFVTRGPGAANASAGVHVAQQDSTPLILFTGQVERSMRGRDAFQELDFERFYGGMAKWVTEVERADDIPRVIERGYRIALAGRPGPVVVALPEDVLTETAGAAAAPRVTMQDPAPSPGDMAVLRNWLAQAERPLVIVGGSRWTADAVARLRQAARSWQVPVACVFRRQQLFDHTHGHYAGDLGIGPNPGLVRAVDQSDLVILLGTRLSEIPSQGYTLLDLPQPRQRVVHVHSSTAELGRVYDAQLSICAAPADFLAALGKGEGGVRDRSDYVRDVHGRYLDWSEQPPANSGALQMGEVIATLRRELAADAIVTNGAGNYSSWIHRFYRFRRFHSQLAPTSGSMGYGLPAAVAGKLRHPDREVVCFAGDGCFQMTGQEFGTAVQHGADVIVIVVDNGMYGTIRMHQERHYPGRPHATDLVNPDFAALAVAYGGHGATVTTTAEFQPAFERARRAGKPAILHLRLDPEAITPTTTLTALRGESPQRAGVKR